jgi:hypothetical protein
LRFVVRLRRHAGLRPYCHAFEIAPGDEVHDAGYCFGSVNGRIAAGYEIRTRDGYRRTIDEMERFVGLDNVGAFHLNDSKKPLGSRVDRHQHIGEGEIGLDAFRFLLNDPRFAKIPKVIETPKPIETESDVRNLSTLRSLIAEPPKVTVRKPRKAAARRSPRMSVTAV